MLKHQRRADNYDTLLRAILMVSNVTLYGQVRGVAIEQRDFRES